MDVLLHADERPQEPLGAWPLPKAGTPDAHYLEGDSRQAADDRPALLAKGVPWREPAEQLGPRADLVAEASKARSDA